MKARSIKFRSILTLAVATALALLAAAEPARSDQTVAGSAKKPLDEVHILALLGCGVPPHRMAKLIKDRGTDFNAQVDYILEVRQAGGDDELAEALKNAKVTEPPTIDLDAKTRRSELVQHLAHGAQFFQQRLYANAKVEYHTAIRLDPDDADLHIALSRALNAQKQTAEALMEARTALQLAPRSSLAHYSIGNVLLTRGDVDGAIAEFRETLRMDPDDELAHYGLGSELAKKGDVDGAIAEYRQTLRLDPNNDKAHVSLGVALGKKGNWEGEIAEEREALRLDPGNPFAHNDLGVALEKKGDLQGALVEYRAALTLDPLNVAHQQNYDHVLEELKKSGKSE